MLTRHSQPLRRKKLNFRPDFIAEDITDIDFAHLKSMGITTCFIDLDGTVVTPGTYAVRAAFGDALAGSSMRIIIATNRPQSRSLNQLESDLSASGVIHPKGLWAKPSKRYMQNALKQFDLQPEQVVMVGDRTIQDVFGANRVGISSLLVRRHGNIRGLRERLMSLLQSMLFSRYERYYCNLD